MQQFRNLYEVPPGRFRWKDTVTGTEFMSHSFDHLCDQVRAHRAGNNLPPVDALTIQDQNCRRISEQSRARYCEGGNEGVNSIGLRFTDILRGTEALLRFKLSGSKLVDIAEAERRAAICATCPYNTQFNSSCRGLCSELVELVEKLVGGAKTEQDDKLNACGVCRCVLKAKVFLPKTILQAVDNEEIAGNYPDFCWMK